MKIKIILLLIMFVAIVGATQAQTLRNRLGSQIGKIETNGTIRCSSGNNIGKIESDGTVRDAKGNRLGKVESSGTVRDDKGNSIGKADGSNRQRVGAVYFFFFFK